MGQRIIDTFESGPLPYWVRLVTGSADIQRLSKRLRFVVEDADATRLADAELGDYHDRPRHHLPWRAPLRMAVRARFSHPADALAGTGGFGFWNNPFRTGGGQVFAPPNALWFFCASARSDMVISPGHPGHGFRAEMINSGTMPGWLVAVGDRLLQLPGLRSLLYRAAQTQVHAGAARLEGLETSGWHDYVLFWSRSEAVFSVDDQEVLRVQRPPPAPLGFVAWMDNQLAIARPDGEFRFGLEVVPGPQWLELDRVEIEMF